jgi:ADP-ribosyl-[dinitrogen reductase] hydrolase
MADLEDRLTGCLLGVALGDALGLPAEGMSAAAVRRRFGRVDRFHLLGSTGFVSDDTEQTALLAQSLVRCPSDPETCAAAFRRALLGWFLRLPWGIGMATVRACIRAGVGLRESGVPSAGNGAAMRATVLGLFFHDRPEERRRFGEVLARVTHTDPRGVQGARYVAELAACCTSARTADQALHERARTVVIEAALLTALDRAASLAEEGASTEAAARELGVSGYVVHTVPFALFCLLRHREPLTALSEAISAGGDTDSIGAILGGWVGALHGEAGLPLDLVERIHDGPFGPTHLRALAAALAAAHAGGVNRAPAYSPAAAMARNAALLPVILGHGLRRLLPW